MNSSTAASNITIDFSARIDNAKMYTILVAVADALVFIATWCELFNRWPRKFHRLQNIGQFNPPLLFHLSALVTSLFHSVFGFLNAYFYLNLTLYEYLTSPVGWFGVIALTVYGLNGLILIYASFYRFERIQSIRSGTCSHLLIRAVESLITLLAILNVLSKFLQSISVELYFTPILFHGTFYLTAFIIGFGLITDLKLSFSMSLTVFRTGTVGYLKNRSEAFAKLKRSLIIMLISVFLCDVIAASISNFEGIGMLSGPIFQIHVILSLRLLATSRDGLTQAKRIAAEIRLDAELDRDSAPNTQPSQYSGSLETPVNHSV